MNTAARLAERLLPLLAATRQPRAANSETPALPADEAFLAVRGPERWLALNGASRAAAQSLGEALAGDDAAALEAALDALVASTGDWLALHAELMQSEATNAQLAEGRRLALAVVARALSDLALWLARVLAGLERQPPAPLPPLRLHAQAEVLRWAAWDGRRTLTQPLPAPGDGSAGSGWIHQLRRWLSSHF